MKLSDTSRYYLISFLTVAVFWLIFNLLDFDFINITFFIMAFIWHFALMVPEIKEKVLSGKIRYSFLGVTVRMNHYLQVFLPANKIPFGASLVRALSPLLFSFVLLVAGGTGNILFTLLGSFVFEVIYLALKGRRETPEIPKVIPNEENVP